MKKVITAIFLAVCGLTGIHLVAFAASHTGEPGWIAFLGGFLFAVFALQALEKR